MKNVLVVGGTSGLGLELARLLAKTHEVIVTGRHDPRGEGLRFRCLDLASGEIGCELDNFLEDLPEFDLLVIAAGFFQEGRIDQLTDQSIDAMIAVGLSGPAKLLARVLRKQSHLPGLIVITSTSQWTPRPDESVYTGIKAGIAMMATSVAYSGVVGKTLIASPAGMRTAFWDASPRDPAVFATMLDPEWVAAEILKQYLEMGDSGRRHMKILRNPARVETQPF